MDTIVLDDFVSDDFLFNIHKFFDTAPWIYKNEANRNAFGVGSHKFFIWLPPDNRPEDHWLDFLWSCLSDHLNIKGDIKEIHANLQVFGQQGTWHKDFYGNGNTKALLYYPVLQWNQEWGGSLDIREDDTDEYVSYQYVPGRIIYMDGSKEHRANAPLVINKGRISLVFNIEEK